MAAQTSSLADVEEFWRRVQPDGFERQKRQEVAVLVLAYVGQSATHDKLGLHG